MPIQIQAPDGVIVEFPDGTPDDVIEGAMRQEYGAPQEAHPENWGAGYQAADTVTMGGSTKIGAAGGALVDSLFGAAQGNGWNYSDAYNRNLEQARADQAAYSKENPGMSAAGTLGGVALGVTSLPTFGKGLLGAVGTGAGYGGAGGALQDASSLEERAWNTAKGGGFGSLLGGTVYGAAKGVSSLLGSGKSVQPPTAEQWHDRASELYKAADSGFGQGSMPVDDVLKLADDFESVANKAGKNNPFGKIANKPYQQTLETVQQFREVAADIAAGNVTQPNYSQLEQLRQSMRAQVTDMVRPDGKMSQDGLRMNNLLDAVDNMLLNSPFEEARAAYATAIKSDKIERAFYDAELTAGSNYTQAGMEKAIQGEFKKIARNKNFEAMFTPEEQEAIKNVVNPGGVQKAMKLFGSLAPKGGLSTMFNVGMTVTNPWVGVPLGAASSASKMASTAKTMNNARAADNLIRSQGVLPPGTNQQMVKNLQRLLLPTSGLLGESYLRRAEYGGPR